MAADKLLQFIFAVGILLLMLLVIAIVAFVAIPAGQLNLFTAIAAGGVGGGFGAVVGFLFGSSQGSRAKDAALLSTTKP